MVWNLKNRNFVSLNGIQNEEIMETASVSIYVSNKLHLINYKHSIKQIRKMNHKTNVSKKKEG